ncbi:MAG: alpha-E domain-containing protein [Acidimicrobiales bacterium]
MGEPPTTRGSRSLDTSRGRSRHETCRGSWGDPSGGAIVRGALHRTMLRNDTYDFARLGTFMGRADNTTRIIDVILRPVALGVVRRHLDRQRPVETILRSVSAQRAWSQASGESSAAGIAEFMILDNGMPRSLAFCFRKIGANLRYLEANYGTRHPSHDLAEALLRRVADQTINSIFEEGLRVPQQLHRCHEQRLGLAIEATTGSTSERAEQEAARRPHDRISTTAPRCDRGSRSSRLHPLHPVRPGGDRMADRSAGGAIQASFLDQYGNHVDLVALTTGVTETTITVLGRVETRDAAGIVARHQGHTPLWLYLRETDLTRCGPRVQRLAAAASGAEGAVDQLHTLSGAVLRGGHLRNRNVGGGFDRGTGPLGSPWRVPGPCPRVHLGGSPVRVPLRDTSADI